MTSTADGLDWPGRDQGITARESEILALITQGLSNADIAALTHLDMNIVRSHIRTMYRTIAASSRTNAVLWAATHGFSQNRQASPGSTGGCRIDSSGSGAGGP